MNRRLIYTIMASVAGNAYSSLQLQYSEVDKTQE